MSVTNILFCGTGGQGVLKAAEICGRVAMREGHHVKKSEVHGMAQRGGSVESHLRFGTEVFSPLVPKGQADFLVSFHKGEHDRMAPFLRPGGADLVDQLCGAAEHLGEPRFLNTYLLGVLSAHLPFAAASWEAELDASFSEKYRAANRTVFAKGRAVGGGKK